jgi:6-phosphogluconolactonase
MDYAHIATSTDEEFVNGGTLLLISLIHAVLQKQNGCLLALSGGSTPSPIYTELGKSSAIEWDKIWICLVDERYVDKENDDSNLKMINETLLKNTAIPKNNILFPDTSLPIDECVAQYNKALSNIKPDIAVLGMGLDGHVASLFPPLTDNAVDREKFCIHTTTDKFAVHDRISMTLPVLARAGSSVFLLKGDEKKKIWEDMIKSPEGVRRWPAKGILSTGGVTVIKK